MIPTTYKADDAALTAINYLDIKFKEKVSLSNTRKFKYLKERWCCKEDDNIRGRNEFIKEKECPLVIRRNSLITLPVTKNEKKSSAHTV